MRIGDVGYFDNQNNLFVLARKKNCIKHAGRTIYPDDVEEVVGAIKKVRQVAAVGIEDRSGSGEGLYIFAELKSHKKTGPDALHKLSIEIVSSIYSHFGIRPARVFLLKARTIPRTPNGKMQHVKLKKYFINDFTKLKESILYL